MEKETSEDDEIVLNAIENLKLAVEQAKIKQSPEVCHLTDNRLGITLELHSTKETISKLIKQSLATFNTLKTRTPTKNISMIN